MIAIAFLWFAGFFLAPSPWRFEPPVFAQSPGCRAPIAGVAIDLLCVPDFHDLAGYRVYYEGPGIPASCDLSPFAAQHDDDIMADMRCQLHKYGSYIIDTGSRLRTRTI